MVIFGIFLSLSYWLFQDELKGVLASVVDGVNSGTLVKIDGSLGLEPEVILVTNPEGDFVFDPATGTITGYIGTRKDVVIPSKISGINVKKIGYRAFYKKFLTSVYIPEGVISIGNEAFSNVGNKSLISIDLPESLISIGEYAFYQNILTTIEIPQSVTSIGDAAFGYNSLTTVYIPSGVNNLYYGVFYENPMTHVDLEIGTTYKKNLSPESANTFPIGTEVTYYN